MILELSIALACLTFGLWCWRRGWDPNMNDAVRLVGHVLAIVGVAIITGEYFMQTVTDLGRAALPLWFAVTLSWLYIARELIEHGATMWNGRR